MDNETREAMNAVKETLLRDVLPVIRDHDITLHGRNSEDGLVKKVDDIRRWMFVCTGIVIAVEFVLKYVR